ncbi:aminotransferase class I/II-fold pyridoxal phosphate-dependent enzyme [Streptomyces sparsus]
MTAPPAAPPRFPRRAGAAHVHPSPRTRTTATNLKSCELRHPDADRLVTEVTAALRVDDVRSYPYQQETLTALATEHGTEPDGITLTGGSDSAIGLLVDAFARPAGRLILADPAFEAWRHYAGLRGVPVTGCPVLTGDPPRAALETLHTRLRTAPGPAVVALANPISPAGLVLTTDEVAALAQTAGAHGHLLVVDECYGAFADVTHIPLVDRFPHLVVVRSYSKSHALAGARIAAVFSHPDTARYLFRFRPDSAVAGPALALLTALLPRRDEFRAVWADVARIRADFVRAVRAHHPEWTPLQPGANFATFVTPDPGQPERLVEALHVRGFRIRAFSGMPGLGGAFRVAVAEDEVMREVADLLEEVADAPA